MKKYINIETAQSQIKQLTTELNNANATIALLAETQADILGGAI